MVRTRTLLVIGGTWEAQLAVEGDRGGQERHGNDGSHRHRKDGAPPDRRPHQVTCLRSEIQSLTVVPVPAGV